MKFNAFQKLISTALLGLGLCVNAAQAQTDSFTYQGRLERNGAAYSGTALMQLKIMDAVSGGNLLASTFGAYAVTNGEFTVTFAAVPASVFNGGNRWIEIGVDDPDVAGLTYVPLTPRQPVTATPYAMRANLAASATTVTGSVPTSQLSGTINPNVLAAGTMTNTLTFNAAGTPFAVGNTGKVVNLNADLLDSLDSTAFLQRSGGAMLNTTKVTSLNSDLLDGLDSTAFLGTAGGILTGNLAMQSPASISFGNTPRQMLNLYNADYAIGVQNSTLYQRSALDFSWFKGGVHHDDPHNPGASGSETMRLTSLGALTVIGTQGGLSVVNRQDAAKYWTAYSDGTGVSNSFHIWNNINANVVDISQTGGISTIGEISAGLISATGYVSTDTSLYAKNSLVFTAASTGELISLFNNGFDKYGIGVQIGTEYFRTGNHFAWFKDGTHSDTTFDAGVGGTTLMTLGGTGELEVSGVDNGLALHNRSDQSKRWVAYSTGAGASDSFHIYSGVTGNRLSVSQSGTVTAAASLSAPYVVGATNNTAQHAIQGYHTASSGAAAGVYGQSSSAGGYGVYGAGASGGYGGKFVANGADGWAVNGVSDTGYAGYFQGKLFCSADGYFGGALSTTVLTIRGGADVAEPFEMMKPNEMEPGCVVVIDEENPGKLKLSTQECDTRVAGIISGAGGVQPGLRLHQEGVMEGDHHVALSGRVYVKADASDGAIEPGDLLTTSANPGHAKKVGEQERARGAILGKAMSRLERGTGLVLVLVTLQ